MQIDLPATTYDRVPYPSYPMAQTTPDHLATLATLLGLKPPRPEQCRVLELGCASGGNLIPLAYTSPDSTFLGIDVSREQIAAGKGLVDALELRNVELRAASILDVDETWGQFDYILCHGVYSWVPPRVQQKILSICETRLSHEGIGYISYNTHPGWHLRGLIRHMLSYHVSRYPDDLPETSVERARRLLEFLARATSAQDGSYGALLREQSELLSRHSDSYFFHEHLEEHNEPIWFLDFCERLAAHRLRYLAEADFQTMFPSLAFPSEVHEELHTLASNLHEKEQYMDFLRNRSFRQTLVCHASHSPSYEWRPERIGDMWVAASLLPLPRSVFLDNDSSIEFTTPEGLTVETSIPIVKGALAYLADIWPCAVPFPDLVHAASERLADTSRTPITIAAGSEDHLALAQALLTTFVRGNGTVVRLTLRPFGAATVQPRPEASRLARVQAARGEPITNLRHELVTVSPFDRQLLPLLDGNRDHAELLTGLMERYEQGWLNLSQDDQPITELDRARAILDEVLQQQLPELARASLLVGPEVVAPAFTSGVTEG